MPKLLPDPELAARVAELRRRSTATRPAALAEDVTWMLEAQPREVDRGDRPFFRLTLTSSLMQTWVDLHFRVCPKCVIGQRQRHWSLIHPLKLLTQSGSPYVRLTTDAVDHKKRYGVHTLSRGVNATSTCCVSFRHHDAAGFRSYGLDDRQVRRLWMTVRYLLNCTPEEARRDGP